MEEHPEENLTPLRFYNDQLAFAMERDRLENSTRNYPFNQFEERTPASATQGDVMDAAENITEPEDAKRFIEGYAQDLHSTHGLTPEQAREISVENLLMGAEQYFSNYLDDSKLTFWRTMLQAA